VAADGRPAIWIHAVSVGEVLAVRPLIGPLRRRFPSHRVLLSTTTLTGNAVAKHSLAGADGLFFAPFDWATPVRRVLRRVRPSLLLLVETEIWPNLIRESRRAGARVAIVNGRISPRSFPRYRRIRPLLARVLAEVDLFLMQAEPHAERARAIGAPPERVRVTGNLKYDAAPPRPAAALSRVIPPGDASSPLVVAGSTVEGEENAVLDAFRRVRAAAPGARLVLVPRHPERFDAVARLVAEDGWPLARRTALGAEGWRSSPVLLLDTLGELAGTYPLATVVFVGGSLAPAGGHNVLEPAAAGRAVVVGPHMENFQEIADELRTAGALVQVPDAAALGPALAGLLADEAERDAIGARALAVVERNRGAVDRTLDALAALVA
jgi:3-deoxy-D-manno-octulosonic-acid transferase